MVIGVVGQAHAVLGLTVGRGDSRSRVRQGPAADGALPIFAASGSLCSARQTRLRRLSLDRQRAATGVARTTQRKTKPMTQTTTSSLYAYAVEDAPRGQKSYWTRIGRLFSHKDGKGYDIVLNALPINGRIVVRQEEPKDDAKGDVPAQH